MRGFFDAETDGFLEELTKVHCLSIYREDWGETRLFVGHDEVREGLKALDECDEIIAHNALGFDIPAMWKVFKWKPKAKVTDSLVESRLAFSDMKDRDFRRRRFPSNLIGRHSLESWGYRLGLQKGGFGATTDWQEYTPEMGAYCVRDVDVLRLMFSKIEKCLQARTRVREANGLDCRAIEHDFQKVMLAQREKGFYFDVDRAIDLTVKLVELRDKRKKALQKQVPPQVTTMKTPQYWYDLETDARYERKKDAPAKLRKGLEPGPFKTKEKPFNPGSRKQVAEHLKSLGWEPGPDECTDAGQPMVDEVVLQGLAKEYPIAGDIADYFMLAKRLGQLSEGKYAWLEYVDLDGRIRGNCTHIGAVTFRCAHSHPNLGQVPSPRKVYGAECRALFSVPEGKVLVGSDLEQLELRMLGHYLFPFDNGRYIDIILNGDIHTENQKAAGLPTRDDAKTFIYALLYGAGNEKLGQIINGTKRDGARLRKKFFDAMPAFKLLIESVQRSAQKGYIIGLDGRAIPVNSDHVALNRLLQGGGAVVGKVWNILIARWYAVNKRDLNLDAFQVAFVHDEVQWESYKSTAEELGRGLVSMARDTSKQLGLYVPLDAKSVIGNNWTETH